jgi:hypothetical protein
MLYALFPIEEKKQMWVQSVATRQLQLQVHSWVAVVAVPVVVMWVAVIVVMAKLNQAVQNGVELCGGIRCTSEKVKLAMMAT